MKIQHKNPLLHLAIAGILSAGLGLSSQASADSAGDPRIGADNSLSSTEAERVMSRSAANVLLSIATARAAIHANDIDTAKKALTHARFMLDVLKTERPTAKAHAHIQTAQQHLGYESSEKLLSDLIPIEADLTEIATFYPVEEAKTHIQAARKHLQAGDRRGAQQELIAADAVLVYSELDLPLSSTEKRVAAAQKALNANQPKQAEKLLEQAENGVRYLSEIVAAPVLQARDDLWMATRDYARKDYAAVKRDLAKAAFWMDTLAASSDKLVKDEADKIKAAIVALGKRVENADGHLDKALKSLWQRSSALAEREAEKASIGWKAKRPDADARADLIDAKQRVAFAENLQFNAMADPADIFEALDQAKSWLEKAATAGQFDGKAQAEIKRAIEEIGMIHDDPKRRGLYTIVRARLRGLIHGNY